MIDLHCHLDGCLSKEDILVLAKEENFFLDTSWETKYHVDQSCRSLNEYLSCFSFTAPLLQNKEALYHVTKRVLQRFAKEGLVYVELRFAPQSHTSDGLSQEEATLAVMQGIEESKDIIDCSLILCYMRQSLNNKENLETLRIASKYLHHGVEAVDLAGAELLFKTNLFGPLFQKSKEAGIPYTIHAGEADSYQSILDALEYHPARIGHGIHCLENQKTIERLKEEHILLEICPTSELQTKAAEGQFPIQALLDQKLNLSINTDDPGISSTSLTNEYRLLNKEYGISEETLYSMLLNSVDYIFASKEVKSRVRTKIKNQYHDWFTNNVLNEKSPS